MGVRFRKSFKIAPGVRYNVGKKSHGISIGGRSGGISFPKAVLTREFLYRVLEYHTQLNWAAKRNAKSHQKGN